MKISEFLTESLEALGPESHWCQAAWFRTSHLADAIVVAGNVRSMQMVLENPSLLDSVCLDYALQITAVAHDLKLTGNLIEDARWELWNTFQEQFPELVEELIQGLIDTLDQQIRKAVESLFVASFLSGTPVSDGKLLELLQRGMSYESASQHLRLPHFNDHESMTYEGVVSTMEKTIARMQERGR